jgi:hypothetical protein
MSETDLNMKDLFGLSREKGTIDQMDKDKLSNGKSAAELKEKIAEKSKLIRWDAVKDVLANKAVESLDIPVVKLLFPAWKKYQEIMEFADQEKHPPDETCLVSLAEHTVKTDHHPYLRVSYRGFEFPRLEFTLSAELTLQGIVLRIQDGKVKEIKEGTIKGKGSLLLEKELIMERPFGSCDLPGRIDLGDGFSLRDPDAEQAATASLKSDF